MWMLVKVMWLAHGITNVIKWKDLSLSLSLFLSLSLSFSVSASLSLKLKFKQLYWHDRSRTVLPKLSVILKTTTTTKETTEKQQSTLKLTGKDHTNMHTQNWERPHKHAHTKLGKTSQTCTHISGKDLTNMNTHNWERPHKHEHTKVERTSQTWSHISGDSDSTHLKWGFRFYIHEVKH